MFRKLVVAALASGSIMLRAASFTITPSVVTNDFVGPITLTITGLTNGSPVVVERYGDFNGNGVIDPGEPLMQSFTVQDGQVATIGGVRNANVPGDEDGLTNGQARVVLFYPGLDEALGRFDGQYLYRISHPANGFAPVTASFTVRQKVQPQGVRGRITAAGSGLPLANASVLLLGGSSKKGVGGTVADANGYFTLYTVPGSYLVLPFQNGYMGTMSAGAVTVPSSQFVTNNLALTSASYTVSGALTDSATGAGLPGVAVMAQSSVGQVALGLLDSTGHYSLKLNAGQWQIDFSDSTFPLLGYVRTGDKAVSVNVTGNTANVNAQATKANALVYGTVSDNQGNPVIGVFFYGDNQGGPFSASGMSYPTNGHYAVAVVADTNGWWVGPDSGALSSLGYTWSGNGAVTVAAGQAVRLDVTLQKVTAHLDGHVLDEFNNPVGSLTIGVSGPNNVWVQTQTDATGNFDLGVSVGNWQFGIENQPQSGFIGSQPTYTVTDGQTISNITYVVRHTTGQITGTVTDDHGNRVTQLGVNANATINGLTYDTYVQTDTNGNYQMNVCNGNWNINLDCSGLSARGYNCPYSQNVTISGNSPTLNFTVSSGSPLQILTTGLGNSTAGTFYQVNLQAAGGQQPYTWSLAPGSAALPANLTLGSDGTLSGLLAGAGNFAFIARVTDNTGATTDQTLFLNVTGAPLQVMTTSLSNAVANVPSGVQLNATGGQPPYSWSLALGSAPLPAGLTLQTNGWFSGTPTVVGTNTFIVRVTDAALASAQQVLSLAVLAPPSARLLAPTLLPGGIFSFTVSGTAGRTFDIYASPDLRNWALLYSTNPPGSVFQVADPIPPGFPQAFFRVQVR